MAQVSGPLLSVKFTEGTNVSRGFHTEERTADLSFDLNTGIWLNVTDRSDLYRHDLSNRRADADRHWRQRHTALPRLGPRATSGKHHNQESSNDVSHLPILALRGSCRDVGLRLPVDKDSCR